MAKADNPMREYQKRKQEVRSELKNKDREFDEKYLETREKYKDDQTTFGKVARVSNEVARGAFKIMKFIIENK